MTIPWVVLAFVGGVAVWIIAAALEMELFPAFAKWLKQPGNGVRVTLWAGALAIATMTWLAQENSWLASLRTEAASIALAIIVIEELQSLRTRRLHKQSIINQIPSQSREFALEAVRLVKEMGWDKDGSLRGVRLHKATLRGVDLKGADLRNASLWDADLSEADLENANLQGADLFAANMMSAYLLNANLQGARLRDANLQAANLQNANLRSADLQDTDLRFACLQGANMSSTILYGADLQMAELEDSIFDCDTIWPSDFDYNAAGATFVNEATVGRS